MLCNVKHMGLDPEESVILRRLSDGIELGNPYPGVYTGTHNLHIYLPEEVILEEFPNLYGDNWENYIGSYGVADSVEQAMEHLKDVLSIKDRYFCVGFCEIRRENQASEGGWRWHKWGEYIGVHKPQCEYLYDEVGIESVWCYTVIELNPDAVEYLDISMEAE